MSVIRKPHEDQRYLNALINNEHVLLDELYRKQHKAIIYMVTHNNGTMSQAKDLFQEVLIDLYQMAKKDYILTCPIGPFIQLMSKRKWLNKLKKNKMNFSGDFEKLKHLAISDTEADEAFKVYEEENQYALVQDKFKMLGPSCKEIIKLSWQVQEDGKYLKWNEIAEQLDLSYAYVRKKAAECKQRLIQLVRKDPTFNSLV